MEFIDLKAQQKQLLDDVVTLREDIDGRIKFVLDHGKYIMGPEVSELEAKLAEYVGVKHCIGVSSGTDALLIALIALGIKPGDEVITTPFSFFSTAETILLLRAKPVFIDIEKTTYNLDPNNIKSAITRRTKAIMPVSIYGQPANFEKINKVAKEYEIPVIEDGAQSFGSKHNQVKSCGLSTIGTTSFFPSKPLGCYGDGGACFTNDDYLANAMRQISIHGQEKRYKHNKIGLNGRLDTIQAAVLLSKMKIFDKEVALREIIGKKYTKKLNGLGFSNTPFVELNNNSVYAQYTIKIKNREKIINYLKEKGIPTSIHYPSLMSDQEALNKNKKGFLNKIFSRKIYKSYPLKIAQNLVDKVLSLPMHPLLSEKDQDLIIDSLINANKKINKS